MRSVFQKPRSRDEDGAIAILVALLALVLLGVGAVAVDMGQVYAKRSASQSNVDLAALAAAAALNGDADCADGESSAAEDFLTKAGNEVHGQTAVDLGGAANDQSGYIECEDWTTRLWAPHVKVDFGLAKALSPSNDGLEVPAYAEAGVFSPDTRVMPAYAVSGCDYGLQTLIDDSPGPSGPPPTPSLAGGTLPATDPSLKINSLTSIPSPIMVGDIVNLSIDGQPGMEGVNLVRFANEALGPLPHYEDVTPSSVANKLVTVNPIPAYVTDHQDVWYVLVSKDNGSTWSNAWPLQVGDAVLECSSAVTDGNFGALKLPRSPDLSTNERLATNMALGLDFDLSVFPNAHANWECTSSDAGAILARGDGTNCVETDTGLAASATESGLITGEGISAPGVLTTKPSNPACGRADDTINFGGSVGSFKINNDILTCYFTTGTSIGAIGAGYSGEPVIDESILDSPRFFWVPVLGKQTSSGGSINYQIVDFRPGFITDQPSSATKSSPNVGTSTQNGIGLKDLGGSKYTVRSVKIVFFDVDALPDSVAAGHPTMTYLGVGPKIISLVK